MSSSSSCITTLVSLIVFGILFSISSFSYDALGAGAGAGGGTKLYAYNTTLGDNNITMYYDEPYPQGYFDDKGNLATGHEDADNNEEESEELEKAEEKEDREEDDKDKK